MSSPTVGNPWTTGLLSRLPLPGLIALLGVVGCAASSAVILYISDDGPIHSWRVQPTVLLAIASAAANVLLAFAFSEAVTVQWWYRAQKGGTVQELHRYWACGHSAFSALRSARHFNVVALGCIVVALVPVNGPLLQRASTIASKTQTSLKPVTLHVATELPIAYTGFIQGRSTTYDSAALTGNFTRVMRAYNNRTEIRLENTGCDGVCVGRVNGVGFVPTCEMTEQPLNLSIASQDSRHMFDPQTVFSSDVSMDRLGDVDIYKTVNLKLFVKDTPNCVGQAQNITCHLVASNVSYPVIVKNNSVGLDPASSIEDDHFVAPINLDINDKTQFFGVALALDNRFKSSGQLTYHGAVGHVLETNGSLTHEYVDWDQVGVSRTIDCNTTWKSPKEDILAAAREIMFRTSVEAGMASSNEPQVVSATQEAPVTVYKSHYLYLALAMGFMLLGVLVVIPSLWGWWELGRKSTLSPIETARAFSAPALSSRDPNASASDLLKEVGERPVRYGQVVALDDVPNPGGREPPNPDIPDHTTEPSPPPSTRLAMANPNQVETPTAGFKFF
ncbi:MAG: hypothetical protein M1833_002830 [Piccolia ochrophora]|nr:MAG: hypothetical protein M1833_002830 [Piccolia ochrophora]